SFAERLNESESLTTNISLLSSSERLQEYIRTHTEEGILSLNMTKKDLASYLSMQPETLTRNFKKLEDERLIKKINNKTYDVLNIYDNPNTLLNILCFCYSIAVIKHITGN